MCIVFNSFLLYALLPVVKWSAFCLFLTALSWRSVSGGYAVFGRAASGLVKRYNCPIAKWYAVCSRITCKVTTFFRYVQIFHCFFAKQQSNRHSAALSFLVRLPHSCNRIIAQSAISSTPHGFRDANQCSDSGMFAARRRSNLVGLNAGA